MTSSHSNVRPQSRRICRLYFWPLGLLMLVRCSLGEGANPPELASVEAPEIRWNTIGYLPDWPKVATIAAGGEVYVVQDLQNDAEVLRGPLRPIQPSAADEHQLHAADFSEVNRPGNYRLVIPGRDTSSEFRVAGDLYNWPFYCSIRAMYLWRCGTTVKGVFGDDTFHHEACHLDDAYLDYVGGPAGRRKEAAGGWHDAGDYNKYTVNGAFTAGLMLHAWEHFHERIAALKLDIPESDNDVPDFLDELRWELDWLLKMQADDGSVYHKLSTVKFGGFVLPENEIERRYFSPWSSAATADFVAILAQAARVYRPHDEEFAKRCLSAATKSDAFLRDHPQDHRPDLSAFETGPYDSPDVDDRLWAAAEMWETTGESKHLHELEARIAGLDDDFVNIDWDWSHVRNLGLFTYVLSSRTERDPALVDRVRRSAIQAADLIIAAARRHPYGRPLDSKYYWGCNGTVARQTMNLHVAHLLTGERQYRAAMLQSIDHVFGRNPFGRSYVTGLGQRPPMFPHDRRSGGDDVAAPWPGYLVGGPWPEATDWYDVEEDYRTNETAINWNGALIYALAAWVEPQTFDASIAAAKRAATVGGPHEP